MKLKTINLVDGGQAIINPEYIVAFVPGGKYDGKEYTKVILNAGDSLSYNVFGTLTVVANQLAA
jgi:hypothetical protein